MKTIIAFFAILLLSSLLFAGFANAQLTGTKNIGTDYLTIALAITDLNTQGVGTGGVTFNVPAGYTETAPAGGYLIGSTALNVSTSATNTITFIKSGSGANPLITAFVGSSASYDGIWKIQGTDYLTIDGIDLQESSGNTTQTTQMEYGYALVKMLNGASYDGCQYVTIRNSSVTLLTGNIYSCGILVANYTAASNSICPITTTEGANSYNKLYSNTIIAANGIKLEGYTGNNFYDLSNEIGVDGSNTISFGRTTLCYGIYLSYQNYQKVNNNNISCGNSSTNTAYGIYQYTGNDINVEINSNIINLSPSGTSGEIVGIYTSLGTSGTSSTVNVKNNYISINRASAASGSTSFIKNYNSKLSNYYVENNTIGGMSSFISGSGDITGISQNSIVANCYIRSNSVQNITRTNSTGSLYGIINNATTTSEISGNTVHSLTNCGSYNYLHGINSSSSSNIFNNRVYNLTSLNEYGFCYGIYTSGSLTNIYNNYISDLKTPEANGANSLSGVFISGTNASVGLYYNTIFLNASSTNSSFGSSGVSVNSTTTLCDFRNNIIVNISTPGYASGLTVAYRWGVTFNAANYSPNSNNNLFYAGTPSPNRLIFYNSSSNSDQTISAFKTRVAPKDAASFSENPPFVNVTSAPFDLHLQTLSPTQCESGGTPVSSPLAIDIDFDGNIRNALSPDVGADEGEFTGPDLLGPSISYTPLNNTGSNLAKVLTATITDASGVPTSGSGLPMLYWKINSGAYAGIQGVHVSGNTYSFTFGSGVVAGDIVSYYIVAQDNASSQNVAAYPSDGAGGFSVNPPTASTPPTTPSSFIILQTLSGTRTIRKSGGDYSSLSGAFNAINYYGVESPGVTFLIESGATFNESATVKLSATGSESAPITFKRDPAYGTGTKPIFSFTGTSNVDTCIMLYQTDYITLDSLIIKDGGTSTSNYVEYGILLKADTTGCQYNTIKHCSVHLSPNNNHYQNYTNNIGILMLGAGMNLDTVKANMFNSFLSDSISNCAYGIALFGKWDGGALADTANVIGTVGSQKMIITNFRWAGMRIYGQRGAIVNNCDLNSVITNHAKDNFDGILIEASRNYTVTNNRVSELNHDHYIINVSGIRIHQCMANGKGNVISSNKIWNIKSQSRAFGIYMDDIGNWFGVNQGFHRVFNNMISGIDASQSGNYYDEYKEPKAVGIYRGTNSRTDSIFNNSVYINYTPVNTNNYSAAFSFKPNSGKIVLMNNVFINLMSTATDTSTAMAVHTRYDWSPVSTYFDSETNNNVFYAGTPGPRRLIFFSNTEARDENISQYKSRMNPKESNSFTENPYFIDPSVCNLKIDITNSTLLESGGKFPSALIDFEGNQRFPNSGYPDNPLDPATAPDVGADEFAGTKARPKITVSMKNLVFESTNSVKFDVFIKNHGFIPWNFCSAQYKWTFNNEILNGGNASFTLVEGTSELLPSARPQSTFVAETYPNQYLYTSPNSPGQYDELVPAQEKRVYTFRLQTSAESFAILNNSLTLVTTSPNTSAFSWYDGAIGTQFLEANRVFNQLENVPLPVHLVSFSGYVDNKRDVIINWKTLTETNNKGFEIERKQADDDWLNVGFVEGKGTSTGESLYKFDDKNLNTGKYNYRLKQIDYNGNYEYFTLNTIIEIGVPIKYSLSQNYPNPFNPVTKIDFDLPENGKTSLKIYDITGKEVMVLVNEFLQPGYYTVTLNATSLASGVYFYRLTTGNNKFVMTKKFVLIK